MSSQKKLKYTLNQPIKKVDYIFPAYDNSIVLVYTQNQDQFVLHVQQNNEFKLFKTTYGFKFTMINQYLLVGLFHMNCQLIIISLKERYTVEMKHKNNPIMSGEITIQYFSESKLLNFISINERYQKTYFIIIYYKVIQQTFPLLTQNPKKFKGAFLQFQRNFQEQFYIKLQKDQKWHISMIDRDSKMIWYKSKEKPTSQIVLHSCYLDKFNDLKAVYKSWKIQFNSYDIKQQFRLTSIYKLNKSPSKFMIVGRYHSAQFHKLYQWDIEQNKLTMNQNGFNESRYLTNVTSAIPPDLILFQLLTKNEKNQLIIHPFYVFFKEKVQHVCNFQIQQPEYSLYQIQTLAPNHSEIDLFHAIFKKENVEEIQVYQFKCKHEEGYDKYGIE